jgi:hypothetical protein
MVPTLRVPLKLVTYSFIYLFIYGLLFKDSANSSDIGEW